MKKKSIWKIDEESERVCIDEKERERGERMGSERQITTK